MKQLELYSWAIYLLIIFWIPDKFLSSMHPILIYFYGNTTPAATILLYVSYNDNKV